MVKVTQKELKEILSYDADTGIFTWIKVASNFMRVGSVAGHLYMNGYISIKINGKLHLAHRLAWLYMDGEWPKDQIDHINHDRSDNRFINLRSASHHDNSKNQRLSKRNKSGIAGVYWVERDGLWYVRINGDRKPVNLKATPDKFEACCRRKAAEIKYGYHTNHGAAKLKESK